MTRYFEDFAVGDTFDLGRRTLSEDEIVAFAREWDPQPFHVDPDRAQDSAFGGLIASGWHTACVVMRLYVDHLLLESASMGSPGVEELRWLAPVRPGDELAVTLRVLEASPSPRRPDRGTLRLGWEVRCRGELVATMTGRGLFGRRPT